MAAARRHAATTRKRTAAPRGAATRRKRLVEASARGAPAARRALASSVAAPLFVLVLVGVAAVAVVAAVAFVSADRTGANEASPTSAALGTREANLQAQSLALPRGRLRDVRHDRNAARGRARPDARAAPRGARRAGGVGAGQRRGRGRRARSGASRTCGSPSITILRPLRGRRPASPVGRPRRRVWRPARRCRPRPTRRPSAASRISRRGLDLGPRVVVVV